MASGYLQGWIEALQDATVLNGLFVLLGVIVTALAGIVGLLIKGRQERKQNNADTAETLAQVKDVKEHVANDHASNLREDLDEKFEKVFKMIEDHGARVDHRFDSIDSTVAQLRKDFEGERGRIRRVEDAQSARRSAVRRKPPTS